MTTEEAMTLVEAQLADELKRRNKAQVDAEAERDKEQYERWVNHLSKGCCG